MLRALIKDSFVYGGADFASKLVSFFTFPVVAAALTSSMYGALELVWTASALLSTFVGFGLNNAVQRFYWDKDTKCNQRPVIVSSGLFVIFLSGFFVFFLCSTLVYFLQDYISFPLLTLSWIGFVAALLSMTVGQIQQFALDVMRLNFAPWKFLFSSLSSRLVSVLAAICAVVVFGSGVDGLLVWQSVVALAVVPMSLLFIRNDLTFCLSRMRIVELIKFGYPYIFVNIAFWISCSMDRWMLAIMSSVEEVGIYSIAFRFSTIVLFVSTAFGQAWSPVAIKIRAEDPEMYRHVYANVLLILLYVMIIVGGVVALFSGELICLFMPGAYVESAVPMAILCFSVVVQATQQITAIGISLEKRTFLFARLAWVVAIVNFVLNLLLIPLFGATGAAWATLFSHVALTGCYLYFTQMLHKLPIAWVKNCVLISAGAFILFCAVVFSMSSLSWLVVIMKFGFFLIFALFGLFLLPCRGFAFWTLK